MKFNKKLSSAIIVSMVVLSAVGCGKIGSGLGNGGPTPEEIENMPKMSEEEVQKGIEDDTIIREK